MTAVAASFAPAKAMGTASITATAAGFDADPLVAVMHEIPRDQLAHGIAVFELFNRAGLAASKGEARRLIRGGGARINDAVVEDETRIVRLDDLGPDGMLKLSAGRKRHAFVRPV